VLKIIVLNAAWVAASVLLLLPGWIHPNGLATRSSWGKPRR